MTEEQRIKIGMEGAENLLGTCSGTHEWMYCPDGVDEEDFVSWVEQHGGVAECNDCGVYCEANDLDSEGNCSECQGEIEE